jgi:hypothetical protein
MAIKYEMQRNYPWFEAAVRLSKQATEGKSTRDKIQ